MHITLYSDEWLSENRTDAAREDIRQLAVVPWGETEAGEQPYTIQHIRRDRFLFGPCSVLWLQSRDARDAFERLVSPPAE
jgi:hypothetical protein